MFLLETAKKLIESSAQLSPQVLTATSPPNKCSVESQSITFYPKKNLCFSYNFLFQGGTIFTPMSSSTSVCQSEVLWRKCVLPKTRETHPRNGMLSRLSPTYKTSSNTEIHRNWSLKPVLQSLTRSAPKRKTELIFSCNTLSNEPQLSPYSICITSAE